MFVCGVTQLSRLQVIMNDFSYEWLSELTDLTYLC